MHINNKAGFSILDTLIKLECMQMIRKEIFGNDNLVRLSAAF